ncbi:MAG TPA: toll/interleukin-1 receptor domain-containing protein [Thermoanaerobaculia bacterium]|nr:toll/interleukin-1 receptor domain-containing protein [Thermoanaerobaculia bacterium]
MAYVPGFRHDIFISYAHVDDEPLFEEEHGWISSFHRELAVVLARKLGRPDSFSIWRDPKVQGNDEFDDTIDAAYRHSAVAIFVLSPGFIASKWCCCELTQFSSCLDAGLDEQLEGRSRVFKVLLSHVPEEEIPPPVREILNQTTGYSFFQLDPDSGREEAFRRTKEQDEDRRYWSALDDLARNLADLLKAMRRLGGAADSGPENGVAEPGPRPAAVPRESPAAPEAAGPAVYLAEVTDDLEPDREDLRRTLTQRGIRVLPDRPLPTAGAELAEQVREDLRKAALSIHLVGSFYGKKPMGEDRSYTHVQLALAAEEALGRTGAQKELPRFVWLPRSLNHAALREEQRELVRSVEEEPDSASPAEVLKVGLEVLKETVIDKLAELFPPPPEPVVEEVAGAVVYVSCQPEDDPEAEEICSVLRAAHHDVVLPIRTGDAAELDRHYRTNLQYCDALMVLYARSPLLWVREEVLKVRRLLAGRRDFVMSIYDGPPPDKEEIGLSFQNLLLIECRDGQRAERLRPFLARLGGRG